MQEGDGNRGFSCRVFCTFSPARKWGASVSRVLSDKFVETWTASHGNVEVDHLDLVTDPLPHQGPDWLEGLVCPPEERTPEMVEALAISDRLIDQLEAADIIVIGAPMINFTLCTQLKSWVDYVTVAGRTFEYFAPGASAGEAVREEGLRDRGPRRRLLGTPRERVRLPGAAPSHPSRVPRPV